MLPHGNCLRHFLIAYAGNAATGNGAVALLDNMPSMDSTQVAQAKAQGAIILARGNMAEWAFTNAISIGSGSQTTRCRPCLMTLRAIVHYGVLHVCGTFEPSTLMHTTVVSCRQHIFHRFLCISQVCLNTCRTSYLTCQQCTSVAVVADQHLCGLQPLAW